MPIIAMNREIGSLGKDVALGLEQALGMKIRHHEIVDHLANRSRLRKSHVISFLEGKQGLLERFTTDQMNLRMLTADEILSLADRVGVLYRGTAKCRRNQSEASRATVSSVPGSSKRCVAPGTITRSFSHTSWS